MKIIFEENDKTLEINFEIKNKTEKSKFNPTQDNPIKITVEDGAERFMYL